MIIAIAHQDLGALIFNGFSDTWTFRFWQTGVHIQGSNKGVWVICLKMIFFLSFLLTFFIYRRRRFHVLSRILICTKNKTNNVWAYAWIWIWKWKWLLCRIVLMSFWFNFWDCRIWYGDQRYKWYDVVKCNDQSGSNI